MAALDVPSQPLPTSPAGDPAPHRAGALELWALIAILVLGAVVRFRQAAMTPLWFDEIITLWVAREGPVGIVRLLAQDLHPPLHFLLVWAWTSFGGDSDLWIKSLSIVFGLATLVALHGFTRELFGRPTALLAAALLAVHPVHVYYSQENRAYVTMWLALTLASWGAWRWVRSARPRDGALFVASAAAVLYLHYFGGVAIAFLALWGLIALRRDRPRAVRWLGLLLAVGLLFVPQLFTLLEQIQRFHGEAWIAPATPADLYHWARHVAYGGRLLMVPLFALALLPLFRPAQRRPASMLWLVSFVPATLAWGIGATSDPLFLERYVHFVLTPWCALVAAGVMGLRFSRLRLALAIGVLVVAARSLQLAVTLPEAVELRDAVAFVREHARPGDTLYFADTHSLLYFRHHLREFERQRIVLADRIPYYEVGYLVPEEWRVNVADWRRSRDGRWWAIHARHGGPTRQTIAGELEGIGAWRVFRTNAVTVWAGQPMPPRP